MPSPIIVKASVKKTESKPRISINKLAEYIEANPSRRKQIVKDAKNPPKFKTIRYGEAREALKKYISKGFDAGIITSAIELISQKSDETDFQEQDSNLSIELLEKILDSDLSFLENYIYEPFPKGADQIEISGVNISVYPDLVIKKEIDGKVNVGALKLHISKNSEMTAESLKIISAVLYKYVEDYIAQEGEKPNFKMCLSHDVFNSMHEESPKSYVLRMKRVEAACEEIALWWAKL